MYNTDGKYLYEILDNYQCANIDKERNDIFRVFCNHLWSVKNPRQKYIKNICYTVSDNCDKNYEIVFNAYTSIPYNAYRSTTKNRNAWYLLRQKINNIYTNMCDNSSCIKTDYLNLLHTPKKLYFRYNNNDLPMTPDELKVEIDTSLQNAEQLFIVYSKQKMNITWNAYKKLIEKWLTKIFDNYICLDDFEDKTNMVMDINYWTEDNYVIKYIGKSLNGYMCNYEKVYYGIPRNKKYRHCTECGVMFIVNPKDTKSFRCQNCQKNINNQVKLAYYYKEKSTLEPAK